MELELPKDFKEFFASLGSKKVRYLLIGGYAVIVYGYSRNTSDIDLVVSNDAENAKRCVEALAQFGFAGEALSEDLFLGPPEKVVQLGFPPVKIEILNYLEGVAFDEAYERRTTVRIEDIDIDVISLEDLIQNKTKVGRLQDLLDIEKLTERNEEKLRDKSTE